MTWQNAARIPNVPRGRRLFLRAVRRLFSPLEPDDYLEMINPLWTTKELRGEVDRVEPQGSEAASILIKPGYEWPGHKPGQYVGSAWSSTASTTGARIR